MASSYISLFFSPGEKPFSCPHCNRAFADRSNLRAHLQTHSDVKKYQCKSCSKTFSRMSLLHKHEESGCCIAHWDFPVYTCLPGLPKLIPGSCCCKAWGPSQRYFTSSDQWNKPNQVFRVPATKMRRSIWSKGLVSLQHSCLNHFSRIVFVTSFHNISGAFSAIPMCILNVPLGQWT